MDDVIDDFLRMAQRCERAAKMFDEEPILSIRKPLLEAIDSIDMAWSRSWIGYQANVYKADLQPCRAGDYFDTEWGANNAYSNRTTGEWAEFTYEIIYAEIIRRSGNVDTDLFPATAKKVGKVFDECKAELLPTFDAVISTYGDDVLKQKRAELEKVKEHISASDFLEAVAPRQLWSRDSLAMHGGRQPPPHLQVKAWLLEECSYGKQATTLAAIARHAATYLQKAKKMKGKTVGKTEGPIFIGHGRSATWQDLKTFLVERLGCEHEEFNRKPIAGHSNKERLLEMLDQCCFAFIVMTAEDEQPDGRVQARQNVVHEAGLFQGRYGFERAIVLLEEGCEEFSNIHGIGQIRFPKANIKAAFEDIRAVLEREGILKR